MTINSIVFPTLNFEILEEKKKFSVTQVVPFGSTNYDKLFSSFSTLIPSVQASAHVFTKLEC